MTLPRLRTGVVGCGLIAQVMHLPHLGELRDRFEVAALCDLSEEARRFASAMYPEARTFTRWEDLLEERLDVVLGPRYRSVVVWAPNPAGTGRGGQLWAVYGPKGGVGVTTIAVNLAIALRPKHELATRWRQACLKRMGGTKS